MKPNPTVRPRLSLSRAQAIRRSPGRRGALLGVVLLAGVAADGRAAPQDGQPRPGAIIPRKLIFGNPERSSPALSPDGKRLAFLAPDEGVMNIWVAPGRDIREAKPVTRDRGRGIRTYFWAYTNDDLIYVQDKDGDENWRVYRLNLASGEVRDLTPFDGVQARIQEVSYKRPNAILVGVNNRDPRLHDIHLVELASGDMTLVQRNDGEKDGGFVGFITDADFAVRFGLRMLPDGGQEILRREADGEFASFIRIDADDALTMQPLGFNDAGDVLYMLDSRERDTAALVSVDPATGRTTPLVFDPKADIQDVISHPRTRQIQAAASVYDRQKWFILDNDIRANIDGLRSIVDGELDVVSRSLDDQHWIVSFTIDRDSTRYYYYDRATRSGPLLFSARPSLPRTLLTGMTPVVIKSRDGLELVSYLTLPKGADTEKPGRPDQPLPMVLMVHGGPWGRDTWGYNPHHQWLANRGYAVLSVNFRGSTGFGKRFVNAADKEWAGKMHDDLIDAVRWAVDQGVADPKRVAIMGGSYGGYAALAGLTFTPDVFACGVAIVGPSNLVTLLESIPPYWSPMISLFTRRVGDHRTEEGRQFLRERSPLTFVDRIRKPLLIGQGANDPRVKQAESDQIVQAMQSRNIPVTYVLYPDEGHGFARPENRLSFYAVAEAFLAEHLGGRAEPFGDDFKGSSITVPVGADEIARLKESLP